MHGGGGGQGRALPHPTPLLIFDCRLPPRYKFLSLPSLSLPLKSEMVAIIFAREIGSTSSPIPKQ